MHIIYLGTIESMTGVSLALCANSLIFVNEYSYIVNDII